MCHSTRLTQYLDLGFTPLADAFLTKYQLNNPEMYYPLSVNTCEDCGLSQLSYVIDPETEDMTMLAFTKGPRGGDNYEDDTYRLEKSLVP
jgi:hypothetical protein